MISTPGYDELRRVFKSAPFVTDLGIALDSVGEGECGSTLEIEPRHLQQDGFVHAGVQATMADHTAGGAAATLVADGRIVLTAEFKLNLLRAARGERLKCRAKVLKPGRRLSVVEAEVFCVTSDQERLVAKATVTLAVVTPRVNQKGSGLMKEHEKINYVEFPAKDMAATKAFFAEAFAWSFTDFGPGYTAFEDEGLDGGFYQSDLVASTANGGALIVFYSQELEKTEAKIRAAGGSIVKPIFSFPGGRRFHFSDPNGNEYAVWSES